MSVDGNFVKYRGYVQLAANLTYGDTTITIYKTLFANNPLPEIQYTIKNLHLFTIVIFLDFSLKIDARESVLRRFIF